jgi:hypothetical protein
MKEKRHVATFLIVSLISASCAHTTPNPVPVAQVGDDTKSCEAIANEMQQMVNTQTTAQGDRNAQVGGNVALGVMGVFLLGIPWFFMDVGNAATVEEKAAQARYLRLQQMQVDRKCSPVPGQIVLTVGPDGKASATQVQADAPTAMAVPVKAEIGIVLTPAQKLENVDIMLKKGLITKDEYDAKKAEILKSM